MFWNVEIFPIDGIFEKCLDLLLSVLVDFIKCFEIDFAIETYIISNGPNKINNVVKNKFFYTKL